MNSRARELHRTLLSLKFRRDGSNTGGIRYTGSLEVSGRQVRSAVIFEDLELARLPRLHLLNPAEDVPQLLAHLQSDGDYCYAHRDALVLDHFAVAQSVAFSIQLMRSSLERSLTSHAVTEITTEFPQHWFGHTVYVDLKSPTAQVATLFTVRRSNKSETTILADSERVVSLLGAENKTKRQFVSIIRAPNLLTFTQGQTRPENFGSFIRWLTTIDISASKEALFAAQRSYPNQPHIFIIGSNGTVGVRLDFIPAIWRSFKRSQALARYVDSNRDRVKLTRFAGDRIDPDFIYKRNMGTQPNLSDKRIVLVGCGTIGSPLAKMLAQSGAGYGTKGHLCLIDQQNLTPGNIGRHLLGVPDIGRPKAPSVRDFLSRLYPDLDLSAVHGDVLRDLTALDHYDLIIDATGDEGVANAINAHLVMRRKRGEPTPASIFVWLFGNGAAAQALCVTSLKDACYRCLRPEHGKPWRFNPLKSKYQTVEIAAQCGEAPYLPYGVAPPTVAAALALQITLDWSKGNPAPLLRTQRLISDQTQQVKDQNPSRSPYCPACGAEQQA